VTAAYVTRLIDSSSNEERERVLAAAVASATLRPLPARRGALTNTRGRP